MAVVAPVVRRAGGVADGAAQAAAGEHGRRQGHKQGQARALVRDVPFAFRHLHEAMPQVEAVRIAVAQCADPKARGLWRRRVEQAAQHRATQAELLELFREVEVLDAHRVAVAIAIDIDIDIAIAIAIGLWPITDATRCLATDQNAPCSGGPEGAAKPQRGGGRVEAPEPFHAGAHHAGAQRHERIEVGLGDRAELECRCHGITV